MAARRAHPVDAEPDRLPADFAGHRAGRLCMHPHEAMRIGLAVLLALLSGTAGAWRTVVGQGRADVAAIDPNGDVVAGGDLGTLVETGGASAFTVMRCDPRGRRCDQTLP
jgi:hypothetical protein